MVRRRGRVGRGRRLNGLAVRPSWAPAPPAGLVEVARHALSTPGKPADRDGALPRPPAGSSGARPPTPRPTHRGGGRVPGARPGSARLAGRGRRRGGATGAGEDGRARSSSPRWSGAPSRRCRARGWPRSPAGSPRTTCSPSWTTAPAGAPSRLVAPTRRTPRSPAPRPGRCSADEHPATRPDVHLLPRRGRRPAPACATGSTDHRLQATRCSTPRGVARRRLQPAAGNGARLAVAEAACQPAAALPRPAPSDCTRRIKESDPWRDRAPAAPPLPDELDRAAAPHAAALPARSAPDVLATARAQRWDPAEVLRVLLDEEVVGRDAATRAPRRKSRRVPDRQDLRLLAGGRRVVHPDATQHALATLEWVGRHENLAVAGPSGTGKSHFVEALAHAAIETTCGSPGSPWKPSPPPSAGPRPTPPSPAPSPGSAAPT